MKRIEDYNKVLPILELYTAIQCEGSRSGYPTIVIRTTGCSHRCYFGEGGWCDSWQTSIHPEKGKYTFNDIVKMYDDNPQISEMMLTGGSPTMHANLVNELTHFAHERGIFITIETEGSHFVETDYPINLISFSPKFSNTIPEIGILTPAGKVVDEKFISTHNKMRLNATAILSMMAYHKDYHFKFVVNPVEQPKVMTEINEFIDDLAIPFNKIWIMPPGDNREELIRVYPMIINWCKDNGLKFTGRDHIIAFDKERFV
jgi:7-carboxy-7-deazaguanine synthase